jgi:hypothetical protein
VDSDIIGHPAELVPDGEGFVVLFQTQPESAVSVFIQLRRRDPSEENASLETLALPS